MTLELHQKAVVFKNVFRGYVALCQYPESIGFEGINRLATTLILLGYVDTSW